MSDFSRPCKVCREGQHEECAGGLCGCIAFHKDDDVMMYNFKVIKQYVHPEREAWTKGGW